jgi:hypothetical protein
VIEKEVANIGKTWEEEEGIREIRSGGEVSYQPHDWQEI